ncbi:MAG TPA: amidase [Gaiellaceae bacterium]
MKDLFDTAGIRTTYGSAVFAEHIPSTSATAVRLLEDAGWVNVGKANLHEFAYGVTSQNLHYGAVPNPRHPELTPGGSSGGSAAALAAGLADGALGTDTGGSIRIPAACCDVTGFKPTYGLVPIDGVFPLAPSFDHAGPLANDVAGCIELMRALVPELVAVDIELSALRFATTWGDVPLDGTSIDFPIAEDVLPVFMREVADVHRELYAEHEDLYGDNIRPKIERCLAVSDGEYDAAVRARVVYAERAAEALDGFDLLLAPTLSRSIPAKHEAEIEVRAEVTRWTFPFNALGWPVLSLPWPGGSVQIIGRKGQDALVLGAGAALERALKA